MNADFIYDLRSSVKLKEMKTALLVSILFFCFIISAKAQTAIQKVDFRNFTYELSCGDADEISPLTVKNGEYRGKKESIADKVYLKIYDVKFGDLNNDEKDEVIVLYACSSGASYVYFRGLIFTMKNHKPILLTELKGGNKGDGGFHDVKIVRNQLFVERYQLPTAGSPCCPAFIETAKYKLKDKKLIQVGRKTSRKIPSS